ncbi:hypothetical protein [Ancylobacter oerskovii]|uniref:Uncharacterized protein n=1 Tax=Ancylobacter oerskovii TaxID=459519 RepID=A0ABW4YUR0_9HYPH
MRKEPVEGGHDGRPARLRPPAQATRRQAEAMRGASRGMAASGR